LSGVAQPTAAAGNGTVTAASPARSSSLLRHARHVLGENPVTLAALMFFCVLLLIAVFGGLLVPFDPLASNTQDALQAPSRHHWFGTDQLGRDIFSRVLTAVRLDLAMAVGAVALSFVVGSVAGACAGFYGGWTDRIVGRVVDTIMAFPLFVLAMAIVAALGNNVSNIVYATAIINLPFYARLGRSEISVLRESGMVEAARLSGNSRASILFRHLYPNIIPPMVVQISLNMGWAMLNAAGLSFIGLGVRPPTAEWGIMVSDGANFIVSGEWWIAFFPGFALMAAVLCFNLLGDGLRDIVDPRRRT
jgi:peptide/nickel transport system permease protein